MGLIFFWGLWLIVSGLAFAVITVIVTIKGLADLSSMFRELRKQQGH
ncbi:MAG TPA: hypothetical protein VMW38_12350 [Terriglobia bacterium]|nr:hypothetical protein [Terriglobia bacterium]